MRNLGAGRLRIAFAVSSLVFCAACAAQSKKAPADVASQKLDRYVRDACGTHPIIRPQAARRVVRAGKKGLAALERFVQKEGVDRLSADLVEALGGLKLPDTRLRLQSWLLDPKFPWPPQAMRAFAKLAEPADLPFLEPWLRHTAHVMRAGALAGIGRIAKTSAASTDGDKILRICVAALKRALLDRHPFVRVAAASELLKLGDTAGLVELVKAKDLRADWFGMDLASRTRRNAERALKAWKGELPKGREKVAESRPGPKNWIAGYTRVSCRVGDLYVRIAADGQVAVGLYEIRMLGLSEKQRQDLLAALHALPAKPKRKRSHYFCDYEVFSGLGPEGKKSARWAPGSCPDEVQPFLEHLMRLMRD